MVLSNKYVDQIRCPLTKEIFMEPVVAADGITYEKDAITNWVLDKSSSPVTRSDISKTFYPNIILKNLVDNFLVDHPELVEERFNLPNTYSYQKTKVRTIISSEQWDGLLELTSFFLDDNLPTILNKCQNETVLLHILDDIVDWNSKYSNICISGWVAYRCKNLSAVKKVCGITEELTRKNADQWLICHLLAQFNTFEINKWYHENNLLVTERHNDDNIYNMIDKNNNLTDDEKSQLKGIVKLRLNKEEPTEEEPPKMETVD